MGTWGTGHFENDEAVDFLYEVEESGVDAIIAALDAANVEEYLEAPEGCRGLVAAALVAGILGDPKYELISDQAKEVAVVHGARTAVVPGLVERARKACDRILASNSGLDELWQDPHDEGDYEVWRNGVSGITASLRTR